MHFPVKFVSTIDGIKICLRLVCAIGQSIGKEIGGKAVIIDLGQNLSAESFVVYPAAPVA
ncbi:hypothetical protein FACS1894190_15510 [Spirochaetia bacterium]|nr:hypothetical protein FACS1894190_15510 [Spirochaetia bacterium]